MANSTLLAIRTKVRRLTRRPSPNQISDADINEYINTVILYDLPEQLRLDNLHQTLTFYTIPYVDTYDTNLINTTDPLYNFKNVIITNNDPVFILGKKAYYTQSRNDFYGQWPQIEYKQQVAVGDGITVNFTGTVQDVPVNMNQVTFASVTAQNGGTVLADVPVVDAVLGTPTQNGNLYVPANNNPTLPTATIPNNTINYVTGVYNITFSIPPGPGQPVWCEYFPYVASRPVSVLFWNESFILRPIPDIPYPVNVEVYVLPTQLLADNQNPDLNQWWQYIAYLASAKILQDYNEYDTLDAIMPELLNQELLVQRRVLVQQGDKRSATIYSQQSGVQGGPLGWWGHGQ